MAVDSGSEAVQSSGGPSASSSTVGNPANGGALAIDVDSGVDSDTGDDEVQSRELVKKLMWIDRSKRHKKALELWRRQDDLCVQRVESRLKQSLSVKNEVYQLIGLFSVFQGVLFTAVSQSTLLQCKNKWTAIVLSGLASFVVVGGVLQKFRTVWGLERTIESEKATRLIYVTRTERLITKGEKFRFHLHAKDGHLKPKSRQWKLFLSIIGIIAVLLLFAGTLIASFDQILCNPGKSKLRGR